MRRWLAVPLAVAAITACSSDDDTSASTTVDTPAEAAVSTSQSTGTSTPDASDSVNRVDLDLGELIEVRPERVLLAAAIIASGDIDDAVAEGLVTPDEVDAAVEAIENDDLARWQALVDG